jgi:hypothetical protein
VIKKERNVKPASAGSAAPLRATPPDRRQLFARTNRNTIVLESPKLSRRHALIHLQNIRELWLIDFDSKTIRDIRFTVG